MNKLGFIAIGLAALVAPALAHHSFSAEYDDKKPVTVNGNVTKVDWVNPHVRFYVDTKDESGKVTTWEFEFGAPNILLRRGMGRNTMKAGDVVTVDGFRAKDGSNLADARTITLPDGRKITSGGDDGAPNR